jgi:hypothetical protein
MTERRLIKYSPCTASELRRFAPLAPIDDGRLCYGMPDVRGLTEYLQHRRVAQIHERMLQRHRAVFGADE